VAPSAYMISIINVLLNRQLTMTNVHVGLGTVLLFLCLI